MPVRTDVQSRNHQTREVRYIARHRFVRQPIPHVKTRVSRSSSLVGRRGRGWEEGRGGGGGSPGEEGGGEHG